MVGTAEALSHFIDALALEIAAIRKTGGTSRIEVRGGERVGTAERQTLYRFPITDVRLQDDAPIQIVCGGQEVSGSVVSLREGILLIKLDTDLGPTIPFAILTTDNSFLIERLRARLEEVQTGQAAFNHASASRVIGQGTINSRENAAHPEAFQHGEMVNAEQRKGINRAFGSNATFVWGPPGTGKTTVLARIVEAFYRTGKSVLLVSNTNIAVDTALEKVAKRLETDSGFQTGAVLRVGPMVKPELKEKYGDRVSLEEIVARLSQDLNRQLQELTADQERQQAAAQPVQKALHEREYVEGLREQASHAATSLASVSQQHREVRRKREEETIRIDQLRADLERARTMGPIRRFFARLDPQRLEAEVRTAQLQQRALTDAIDAAASQVEAQQKSWQALQRQLQDEEARIRHYPSLSDCQKSVNEIQARITSLGTLIHQIQQQL